MSRFHDCLEVVLGNEGGLSDHKADRGGRTNYGVTQTTYSNFRRAQGRPSRPVDEITRDEVEAIYGEYWQDCKASYLPIPLDLMVFDCAINSGAKRAIRLLQRVLGVDEDGIAGRMTMDALHEEVVTVGVEGVCRAYLNARADWYDTIIERDPAQAVFAKGWMNRLDHLRSFV